MASEISTAGNGIGFIYVTQPDDATNTGIVYNLPNNEDGLRDAKNLGVVAVSLALNRQSVGTITVDSIAGAGTITAIPVGGINQLLGSATIAYTGVTTTAALATSIASAINSGVPASGPDYVALAISNVVYLLAPASSGSAVNGDLISVTNTGNLTVTVVAMADGSDATTSYDTTQGYRFFLDSSSTAAEGDMTTGTEITDFIVPRGLHSALPESSLTISSGKVTVTREAIITHILVDTEGSATADDLDGIVPQSFADGDMLIIRGANGGRIVTVKDGVDNINLTGDYDFATGTGELVLWLRYDSSDGNFYEVTRSTQRIGTLSEYRDASIPLAAKYGKKSYTAADNTTDTHDSDTDEDFIEITGTVSLSAGDYVLALSTTNAVKGDSIHIKYQAAITVGSQDVTIAGRTLTDHEALIGKLYIYSKYNGTSWDTVVMPDFNDGYELETTNYEDNSVTVAMVEDEINKGVFTVELSFESGETGDIKVVMANSCTVDKLSYYVTKAIEGTDDASVTPKDAAGLSMGATTITKGSAIGTGFTNSPSSNNVIAAGDVMELTTSKLTAGGKVLVSIEYTKT